MIQYTHAIRCTANSLLIVNKIKIWVSYMYVIDCLRAKLDIY